MSTTPSGLSRRRAGGAPSPAINGSNPVPNSAGPSNEGSRPTTPSALNGQNGKGKQTGMAGSGHKIAFDERDLENGEETVMPKLTLMEEVLLLGLKDKQVRTLKFETDQFLISILVSGLPFFLE